MECCGPAVEPNSSRKLLSSFVCGGGEDDDSMRFLPDGLQGGESDDKLLCDKHGSSLCNCFLQCGNEKVWIRVLEPCSYTLD